jgi:putative antirepressor
MEGLKIIDERTVLNKDFRIYGDFENPLFLAKDVAEWIEHSNSRSMLDSVDDTEKVVRNVYTLGGNQESWFLTEDGLYEVLMQSRKPIAKAFKKEVKEILKSVRRHGAYMTDRTLEEALANPDFGIKLLTKLKEEKEARKKLEAKVEEDKPKVIFADAVSSSNTSILIGDLAKILKQNGYNTGQQRLFEILRSKGFLMKSGASRNMPTQRAMEMKLFEVKETTINNPDGSIRITKTTKVTGIGQKYFINYFLKSLAS